METLMRSNNFQTLYMTSRQPISVGSAKIIQLTLNG